MKLKEFLKQNNSTFSYCDLILLERKTVMIELQDMEIPKKEVYRGLIFKCFKCTTKLKFTNASVLFDQKEHNQIKQYLNRIVLGYNIQSGNDYKDKKIEIIITDKLFHL